MPPDPTIARHDTSDGMARNAVIMSAATMVSRVTGLAREMVFAAFLGDSNAAAAYAVAINVPNRLRQLFAEAAMSAAFTPMMAEAAKESPARLWQFVRRFTWTFLFVVALVVLAGIAGAAFITRLFAPAWRHEPDRFDLTTDLMRIVFPYLALVAGVALLGAILNYFGDFFMPSVAPALFNTTLILTALVLASTIFTHRPVYAFAMAWLVAGLVQIAVQLPRARARGLSLRPELGFSDPLVLAALSLLVPRLLGYAVGAINDVVAQQAATGLGAADGRNYASHLYYAMRITELVLGGFVTSVSTVILPTMARQVGTGQKGTYLATINGSLRAVAFITIPSAVALTLIGGPVVSTLLERQRFDSRATSDTSFVLAMYCIGLFAFGSIRVLVPAFFAQRDTWTPFFVGAGTVAANVILIRVLSGPLRHGGIALSLALVAYAQMAALLYVLRRRMGPLGGGALAASIARSLVAGGLMGVVLWLLLEALPDPSGELARVLHLSVLVASGAGTYFAASWLLRSPELLEGTAMVRRKLAARRRA